MILRFLIVLLIYTGLIIPQSDQGNPSVELPDFVITGKDVISIRRVDKMKPDFIPTVTKEFLKPVFKPEDLEIAAISNPIEGDMKLLDSVEYYKGIITLNAGRYTMPGGIINYAFPFERGMLHGILNGINQLDYVDNSERVEYSGQLDFNYTIATDNDVLPGTKFYAGGKHTVNKYNFFGSIDPERKRTLNMGNARAGIQNLYTRSFIFDLEAAGDFTYLDSENFNESIFRTKGYGKYNLGDFSIALKTDYQLQNITTDSLGKENADYLFLRPTAAFKIFNKFIINAGFTFTSSQGEYLNDIYASFGAEVSKNLALLAEYSPYGEFVTSGSLLRNNFYFNPQQYNHIFVKRKNLLNVSLVYEFNRYFQIDGGLKYFRTSNLPYYSDVDSSGVFEVDNTDAKNIGLFGNLLFHVGPYGVFYGSLELNNLSNSDGKKIPYYPAFRGSLAYGYPFTPQFMGKLSLEYLSNRYTDIENTNSLDDIFDLGLLLEYKFWNNLLLSVELNNILGMKNYRWSGYQEKPFDITFGASLLFN